MWFGLDINTVMGKIKSEVSTKLDPGYITKRVDMFYKGLDETSKIELFAMLKQDPELFYASSLLFEKQGNVDKAIAQIKQAINLSPDNKKYTAKLISLSR